MAKSLDPRKLDPQTIEKLRKAKEIAKTSSEVRKNLENTNLMGKTYQFKQHQKTYEEMKQLAEATGTELTDFVLYEPLGHYPIHLPPPHHDPHNLIKPNRVKELKTMIKDVKRATRSSKNATQYSNSATNLTQNATQPKKRGRPRKNSYPLTTAPHQPSPYQTETSYNDDTSTTNTTSTITHNANDIELYTNTTTNPTLTGDTMLDEKLSVSTSPTTNSPAQLPPTTLDDKSKTTSKTTSKTSQKVSHKRTDKNIIATTSPTSQKVSHKRTDKNIITQNSFSFKKLSRGEQGKLATLTPVIYNVKTLQSKTALSVVAIFSAELTPAQIEFLYEHKENLPLTHTEVTALELLVKMPQSEEYRKQYWKIQEQIHRDKKTPQSAKTTNSTLLEEKLASAEEAIFGEVIKPIDKPKPL